LLTGHPTFTFIAVDKNNDMIGKAKFYGNPFPCRSIDGSLTNMEFQGIFQSLDIKPSQLKHVCTIPPWEGMLANSIYNGTLYGAINGLANSLGYFFEPHRSSQRENITKIIYYYCTFSYYVMTESALYGGTVNFLQFALFKVILEKIIDFLTQTQSFLTRQLLTSTIYAYPIYQQGMLAIPTMITSMASGLIAEKSITIAGKYLVDNLPFAMRKMKNCFSWLGSNITVFKKAPNADNYVKRNQVDQNYILQA
jgi:hypothetical protein